MSGFLSRLATRSLAAAGARVDGAPLVLPRAASLFEPPASGWDPDGVHDLAEDDDMPIAAGLREPATRSLLARGPEPPPAAAPATNATAPAPAVPVRQPAEGMHARAALPVAPMVAPAAGKPAAADPPGESRPAVEPDAEPPRPAPPGATRPSGLARVPPLPPAAVPPLVAARDVRAAPESPEPAGRRRADVPTSSSAPAPPQVRPRVRGALVAPPAAPLPAGVRALRDQAATGARARPNPALPDVGGPEPVVHVTIGTVEVRAPAETPPRRAPARAVGAPAVGLSSYLQRRERERR